MHSISSVCVCGAGTMGSGIAQLCAQSGFKVTLYDVDPLVLSSARSRIESNLEKLVEKGKLDGSGKKRTFELLQFSSYVSSCKADCVIEAIVEKLEVKVGLFQQLEQINDEQCIFASNTSSLSITALASAISRKEKLVGLHF